MSFIDSGSKPTSGDGIGAADTAGGISSLFSNNPNLLSLGVAGLGFLDQNKGLPFQGDVTNAAGNLNTLATNAGNQSNALASTGSGLTAQGAAELSTGQLAPGGQAVIQQYLDKQNAAIKSRYASVGQTGSTMETDALNTAKQGAEAQQFQIAQQQAQLLFQAGSQATSQSLTALGITEQAYGETAKIYSDLMAAQMKQDQGVMSSIGSFASALGNVAALAL